MADKPEKYAAEKAIEKMAKFLNSNGGERPLALVSDSYDRQEVAKHLMDKRLGASLVISGSLLAAADYEQDISLAAVTYINDHYLLAKNVASMRLLVQIYSLRRNRKEGSKFPFASSALFRDIVLEIEQTGKGLLETEAPAKGNPYYEELRFVRCIWDAYMQDKHDKRAERLKKYAEKLKEANTPVAYLHWGEPDKQITTFLDECDPARVFEAELGGKAKKLENCWSGTGKAPEAEPLAYEAQTLEEAAWASRKMLLQWLNEHKQDDDIIGIIDYDRALIRRLHSLLMQDGIFLQETTGWPANNLLVGKALLALASGAPRTELISRLQNVIVRKQGGRWARLPRDLAKGRIEDHGWQKEVDGLTDILDSFTKENSHSKSSPGSISAWFDAMAKEAETGFLKEFFEQDAAGQDLRPLLHMLADEFAELEHGKDEKYDGREVGRLLFDSLSSIDLNSSNNDSRVQLVPPGRFTTRQFKAMLLAGADADTLPSSRAPQLLSDDARKKHLGLPTREEQTEKRRKSTALLLGNSCQVGAVWYGQAGISPYIDLMSKETKLLKRLDIPWDKKTQNGVRYDKAVRLQEKPDKISVSACVELLACPYRYHAGRVLKLSKDEPATIGQANKYGIFVHEILEEFHNELKGVDFSNFNSKHAKEQLKGILKKVRDGNNGDESKTSKMSGAERRYFAWQFEHHREIYVDKIQELFSKKGKGEKYPCIEETEVDLKGELQLSNQETIKITGKADRIDRYGEKSYAVIDVKTGSAKKYVDYTSYPQLPLYMKLYGNSEKNICFENSKFWVLSLESGTNDVSMVPDHKKEKEMIPENAPNKVFELYQEIFTKALNEAKLLPANGVQSVCQYCEYGGLCRKKHWDTNNNKKKK